MSKAVAFDIDGVLLRGSVPIPGADKAIQRLQEASIPFVFVTNGGGMHEAKKAQELRKKLGVDILDSQVIVCHTPFQQLAAQFSGQKILLIGREDCIDVAQSYGFDQIVTPKILLETTPHLLPTRKTDVAHPSGGVNTDDIAACFIFHDPIDWSLEMQVLHDVILDSMQRPQYRESRSHLPVFACNADLVYATEHPLPRFTQGAFVESFRHLFQLTHPQAQVHIEYYGKPFAVQYRYAERVIHQALVSAGRTEMPSVYFGIGDNPKSDIRGANNAGECWRSILVHTGLFQDAEGLGNDPHDPADLVFPSVLEAVEHIISTDLST